MNINPCCKCGNDVTEHITHNDCVGDMEIHCACGHTVRIPGYTSHQVTVKIWNQENPILNKCTNCHGANLLTLDEDTVKDYQTIRCGCGMFAQVRNEFLEHDNDVLIKCWNDANPLPFVDPIITFNNDEFTPCIECGEKNITMNGVAGKAGWDHHDIKCNRCGHVVQINGYVAKLDMLGYWNEANTFINESSPISEQAYKNIRKIVNYERNYGYGEGKEGFKKLLRPSVVVSGAEIDPEWLKEALGRVVGEMVQKIVKYHLSKVNRIPMNIEKLRRGPRADICGVFKVQYMDGDGQLCGVEDISERRVVKFLGEEKATALKLGRVEDGHVDTSWARYTWED